MFTRQNNLKYLSNTTKANFIAFYLHSINIERNRFLAMHLKNELFECDHREMKLNQLIANENILMLNEITIIICFKKKLKTKSSILNVIKHF